MPPNPAPLPNIPAMEKHFTPEELGELWGLSADTIRRLFDEEPGVLVIQRSKRRSRRYRTLRIPASVAERVHRRESVPAGPQQAERQSHPQRRLMLQVGRKTLPP